MAKISYGMMSERKVLQVITKIDGKYGATSEGIWVTGGGIEISCVYFLYEVRVHKSSVREKN